MTVKKEALVKLKTLIEEYTQPNELSIEKDLLVTRFQVETLQLCIQAYLNRERGIL